MGDDKDQRWLLGINTLIPNKLSAEILQHNLIPELSGYTVIKKEVTFEDCRFDLYAENDHEKCFIEVKNVTLKNGIYACFPDAVQNEARNTLPLLLKPKSPVSGLSCSL